MSAAWSALTCAPDAPAVWSAVSLAWSVATVACDWATWVANEGACSDASDWAALTWSPTATLTAVT